MKKYPFILNLTNFFEKGNVDVSKICSENVASIRSEDKGRNGTRDPSPEIFSDFLQLCQRTGNRERAARDKMKRGKKWSRQEKINQGQTVAGIS